VEISEQMRADWNQRAREDANYYVAFGHRDQEDSEFLSTAADVVRDLEVELNRLPAERPVASRRALEIGCGPGRLMRPMSRHFGEIHGIDVSDEMAAQASAKLADIPHAHAHHASGSDLARFPDEYFDFVYSYAVFQHIPSVEVVFSYFRETVRVLRPGGFARLQINGLPKTARAYTTWEGARIDGDEIYAFTREHGVRLLSLTGTGTQYMWTTWQKPPHCHIRYVTNWLSGEQAIPSSGRLACASLLVENLPEGFELNSLTALVDGVPGNPSYVGPAVNGLSQVNVFLPHGVRTGLVPLRLEWQGRLACPDHAIRVITPGPALPQLISVSDGTNLLSVRRIESRTAKVTIEEIESIDPFKATVDGMAVLEVETFRTDPLLRRYEVNFRVPDSIDSGVHMLEIHVGRRLLTRMEIEIA
jgi:ubiquinone/menaquinone biosynthesis C-methylase UbiE